MCTATAIGVNDDFATGEACVAVGTADDKFAGGVDVKNVFAVKEGLNVLGKSGDNLGNEHLCNIVVDCLEHFAVGLFLGFAVASFYKLIVLCRYYDSVNSHGFAVGRVFYCNLAL